jgi:hypothetical protein
MTDQSDRLAGMNTYIDGKLKRYNLLFAVNGGAFAIAQLLADADTQPLLGGITPRMLALGAIGFTILMAIDIWLFGTMMRREFFDNTLVFSTVGKLILLALALLLISGWLLAAFG